MSLLSQTGQNVMVLEEGPFQSINQLYESAVIQTLGDGPYNSTSQIIETALLAEEESYRTRLLGTYGLLLIEDVPPNANTPFLGQGIQEVLLQSSPPPPDPSFVNQLAQLHLFEDRPPPGRSSGIQSATIILEERPLPVPAMMSNAISVVLLEEPQVLGIVQQYEAALIEEQPPLNGVGFIQGAQVALVEEERAPKGVIIPQAVSTALILTQKPLNDSRLVEAHHLALHVDISGVTTLSNTVGAIQITLIQAADGVPQPDPTRTRFESMSIALDSTANYPQFIQSSSRISAVLTQAAIAKSMPAHVQSFSKVFGVISTTARRAPLFIDPSQLGSFVQSRNVISNAALSITKQRPSTIHSASVLRGIAHLTANPIAKPNPEAISSTEQIPSVVMQTTMRKQYGSANINSTAQQTSNVMPIVMHKDYVDGETIQSKSIMKKMSRLVSRRLTVQPLDTIRSQTMVPLVSNSISYPATFMDPDIIRPILSLSGMVRLTARTVVMPQPTDIFAPVAQYASTQLVVTERLFIPPDEILGSSLFQYAAVKLVAISTFYTPPEQVEVVRREVYGTYYSELDNN